MVVNANHRADGIGGHLSTLRLVGRALRGRLQPLLPRQGRRPARRRRLLPGPRRARHVRPGLPRGSPRRGPARQLPPRALGWVGRALELPAPVAHARLLGVPHGLDGPRPDQLDLPGPVQPLPAQPPHRRHQRHPGVVLPRRRRVRRARDPRLDLAGRPAKASTTSRGSSTATCSGSTVRCAATARSSRSSRRMFRGAGLERHQGHLGLGLGRAAGPRRRRRAAAQDEHHRRRRVPALRGRVGRLHPRALLRARPAAAGAGRAPERRRPAQPALAAATTTRRSTPPTRRPPSRSAPRR